MTVEKSSALPEADQLDRHYTIPKHLRNLRDLKRLFNFVRLACKVDTK